MDDGFDHAVTVVGDQVESLLGFGKGEVVSHKLIEVDGAVRYQLDRRGHAPVLPADVLQSYFLAP